MTGLIVGLTGGIGSGKSAAADMFVELGAAAIDTDVIARALTAPQGEAMAAIREAFGDWAIAADGSLDRAAMRRLVFGDAAARQRLEAILHPAIRAASDQQCAAALAAGAPYVVLVVPLLVEGGDYRQRVARVAVVDCSAETQIARVVARNGLSRKEVIEIMAVQATRAQRQAAADDLIDNEGNLTQLRRQVEDLHRRYRDLAAQLCKS